MIHYRCPKCGSEMEYTVIDTNPPIDCFRCPKCGYHYDSYRNEPQKDIWIEIPLKDENNPIQKKGRGKGGEIILWKMKLRK